MPQADAASIVSKGRRTTFTILTIVFGAAIAGLGLFSLIGGASGAGGREEHQVHDMAFGVLAGMLIGLPLLIQSRNPERKPALMQGAAAAGLGFVAGYALGGERGFVFVPVAVVAILWWLHPAGAQLIGSGRVQPILAALAILAAVPLVVYTLDQAEIQRACPPAGDQHCEEFHFAGMAALALALPLTGLAASLRSPGWRASAWLVGGAAVVFGLSGLLLPDHLSSIQVAWGSASIAAGVLFVLVAEWARRGEGRPNQSAPASRPA